MGKLRDLTHTLIFFESPHRVVKCLNDMRESLGDRQACLAREISKLHEQFIRGSVSEIIDEIGARSLKGEIVLVVAGAPRRRPKEETT